VKTLSFLQHPGFGFQHGHYGCSTHLPHQQVVLVMLIVGEDE
jgi:hypothetical protein